MSLASGGNADVSVLVPAANEAENLPEFLRQCEESFGDLPYSCEVVVVDDGSTDRSLERLLTKLLSRSVSDPDGWGDSLEQDR
mgnify:CR=1 FL=1